MPSTPKHLYIKVALYSIAIFLHAATSYAIGGLALAITSAYCSALLALLVHVYFKLSWRLQATSEEIRSASRDTSQQVQSLFWLMSFIRPCKPLPPMGGYAISADFATTLISTIARLQSPNVLELGSGCSTLLAGYALEQIGRGRVYSVDHDEKFLATTRQNVQDHGLNQFVELIHAPLQELKRIKGKWGWYNPSFIDALPMIDLLVVDGPPRWVGDMARYPALPMLLSRLTQNSVILIDDAGRDDETRMVEQWLAEYPQFEAVPLPGHEKGATMLRLRSAPARRAVA